MDPHERQSQPQPDGLEVPPTTGGGRAASTGSLPPPDHDRNNNTDNANANAESRDASPSRQAAQPATPLADAESTTEYFPPLEVPPSLLQAPSHTGSARPRSYGSNVSSSVGEAAPAMMRQPSIRIRRRSSSLRSNRSTGTSGRISDGFARLGRSQDNLVGGAPSSSRRDTGEGSSSSAGEPSTRRPRSISQPERAHIPQDATTLARHSRRVPQIAMPRLTEEGARPSMAELGIGDEPLSPARSLPEGRMSMSRTRTEPEPTDAPSRLQGMRRVSRFIWPRRQGQHPQQGGLQGQHDLDLEAMRAEDEYNERLVDYLDTIDPEVQTLSTLTNVQNSLFVPDLGKWVNRRPTYTLSDHDIQDLTGPVRPPPSGAEQMGQIPEKKREEAAADTGAAEEPPPLERSSTITSRLTDSHYAALPHGRTLEGWTAEEKRELDDHVRHMMHSRRSKFKRTMKGFGQYVRRPLGFLVTLYATLITLFGLAWVLFLIGWIYVGDKQLYIIHIIDSVLVALFAIMGDGLAPFRAIDTYHMVYVLHYARIVKKGCKKRASGLEKTESPSNEQQSPDPAAPLRERTSTPDLEAAPSPIDPHTMHNNIVPVVPDQDKTGIDAYEDTPLTYAQQKKLHHHQKKLAKSHSFYKPNETTTHYAFPLRYLVAIVILLDCHSCLQISLGATTWGMDYRTRPFAITTVILCVSITCNVAAGVVISIGDRKTRKKDVWQLMTRQELTGDAMRAIEQKRSASNSNSNNDSSSKMAGGGAESDVHTDKSKEIAATLSKLVKKPTPEAGEKSQ